MRNTDWASDWSKKGFFSRERPQKLYSVDQFEIGKYTVTAGEFRQFILENGYTNPIYWTKSGWEWVKESNISEPAFWDQEMGVSEDLLPAIGVSWYEAVAFCKWMSLTHKKTIAYQMNCSGRGLPEEAMIEFIPGEIFLIMRNAIREPADTRKLRLVVLTAPREIVLLVVVIWLEMFLNGF